MNHSFTAIDFETAHNKRWSICQIGLVRINHHDALSDAMACAKLYLLHPGLTN